MRKGIDVLSALVVGRRLRMAPFSGHFFCFFNKSRD